MDGAMKNSEWSKTVQNLVWIGQLGLSIALPLGVFIFLAVYLKNRFDLGAWVRALLFAHYARSEPDNVAPVQFICVFDILYLYK